MMKKSIAAGAIAAAAGCSFGQIVAIEGLFTTGSDGMGSVLNVGEADIHYSGGLIVVNELPSYANPPLNTTWIGPSPSDVSDPPGSSFAASLTFDLTGFDSSTAVITGSAAADDGVFVSLNGDRIPFFAPASTLGTFEITDGFLPGLNTLTFSVGNSDVGGFNPTALLVGSLSGTVEVPAPASAAVLLGGVFAFGRRRRG